MISNNIADLSGSGQWELLWLLPCSRGSIMTLPANELLQAFKGRGFATADVSMCNQVFEQIAGDAHLVASSVDRVALATVIVTTIVQLQNRSELTLLILVRAQRELFSDLRGNRPRSFIVSNKGSRATQPVRLRVSTPH
jgi:hypothetical protein